MAGHSHVAREVRGYELIRELGRGGMAVVYLARQLELDRRVAVKELSSFQAGSPESAKRFLREARLAGSLGHPNIVTVHDYFEHDGIPYLAMEYVERGSLRPYVGRLTLAQLAGVIEGVLAGLAHAEQGGIVHRDLKPENILVTGEGRVKIADFGIAKATQTVAMTSALTAPGAAIGTPAYMAPEQAMAEPVGPWTDLYSVGVIAYEQVAGRPPFHGAESPMVLLMRHVSEPPVPLITVKPDVDPALSAWIDRLLVKNPPERCQSAVEAWDSLEEIIIGLLGPRWRREARLDEPDTAAGAARPLTPAPFQAKPDEPSSPASADGFVTYDPDRSKATTPAAAPKREAPAPAEPLRAEAVPAETPPAEPRPAEALPLEPLPAEALPAEPLPAEALPAEPLPAEALPAEPLPVETLSTETAPTETGASGRLSRTEPTATPSDEPVLSENHEAANVAAEEPGAAQAPTQSATAAGRSDAHTASERPTVVASGDSSSDRKPRRLVWLALVGLVAVAGVIVAIVAGSSGGGATTAERSTTGSSAGSHGANGAPASSVTRSLPGGITVRGPIALPAGGTPAGLVAAGSDAWVTDTTNNMLVRLASSGSELRVPVGREPVAVALDRSTGDLWVANAGSGDVTVTDASGRIRNRSIKVGTRATAISFGSGAAWVASRDGTTITRIDAQSFATRQIDVGARPTALANAYGRLWVGKRDLSMTVLSGSGALNGSVPRLPGPGMPLAISASNGVWVARAGGGLTKIDPRTQVAVRRTPPYQYVVHPDSPSAGADPSDVDALQGDNTIWVISRSDHLLSRIGTQQPHNNQVLAAVPVGEAPDQLAVSSHVVWVSDPGQKALYKVTYP